METFQKAPMPHTLLSISHAGCNDGRLSITLKKKEWDAQGKLYVERTKSPITKQNDGTISVDVEELKDWIGKVNFIFSGHGTKTPFIEVSPYLKKYTEKSMGIEWTDIGPKQEDAAFVAYFDYGSVTDHHPGSTTTTMDVMNMFPEDKRIVNISYRGCGAMLTFYQMSSFAPLRRPWLMHVVNWMDIWTEVSFLWTPAVRTAIKTECLQASPALRKFVAEANTDEEEYTLILEVLAVIRDALWNQRQADELFESLNGDDFRLGQLLDDWVEKYVLRTPIAEHFVDNHVLKAFDSPNLTMFYAETNLKKDVNVTGGDYFYQTACNSKLTTRNLDGSLKTQVLVTADRMTSGDYRQIGVRKIPNTDENNVDCCIFAKFVAGSEEDVFVSAGGLPVASAMQAKPEASMEDIYNAVLRGAARYQWGD